MNILTKSRRIKRSTPFRGFVLVLLGNLISPIWPNLLAQYDHANLSGQTLRFGDISYYNFNYANLSGATLVATNDLNTQFFYANLRGANLSNVPLYYPGQLDGATYDSKTIWPAGFSYQYSGAFGPHAQLSGYDFSTDLSGIDFTGANLKDAFIGSLSLAGDQFNGANLCGTYMYGAYITGASFKGAFYDSNTFWPAGFDYQTSGAFGPNAILSGCDLSGVDLSQVSLSGTILTGAIYDSNTIWPTNFPYQNSGAIGPNADLTGVNFSGINLSGINLTIANLDSANLTGAIYDSSTVWPTNFPYQSSGAYGPNANLSEVNLSGINLSGINFTGALFTNTLYTTNTIWPTGFDFLHLGALGPGINFQGENLSLNNLRGIDFTAASFTNCNLTGCNFSGSILYAANFKGANLSNAVFTGAKIAAGTIFPKGFNPIAAGAVVLNPSPKTQTIKFPPLPAAIYGGPQISLKATAFSKLPCSYLVGNSNVASVLGSNLIITGAGTTTVSALQYGNSNFFWAPPVSQKLVVSKALQTFSFTPPANTPSFFSFKGWTYAWIGLGSINLLDFNIRTSAGLPVTLTSGNIDVASVSGSTMTLNGVGATTIIASQAGNANYLPATSTAYLYIFKNPQTITFNPLPTQTFGEPPFTITASCSSELMVSFSSSNPKVATISGDTVTVTGVGVTTITATQSGNGLYSAAKPVSRVMTVKAFH